MKFLLCIGSAQMSHDTIVFGGKIAAAYSADLSVLYVGPPSPRHLGGSMNMSRMKLSEWEIDLPGVKVLEYAEDVLVEQKILQTTEKGEVVERHSLKPDIDDAYELHALGSHGENIRLRLREGDIVDQIKKEVDSGQYDIAIMGASKERRLIDRIIQFVDSSLFITKNIKSIDYRFLFCYDGTELSRKALYLGCMAAVSYKAEATLLMAAKKEHDVPAAEKTLESAAYILEKRHIPFTIKIGVGDPIKNILDEAGDNHIVVMGSSRSSAISKYFRPTKAVRVVQEGNSPVLIAK